MNPINIVLIAIGFVLCGCLYSCKSGKNNVGMDIEERNGFKIKTFYDASENIEVVIITDKESTIVATPLAVTSRQRKMSDEEYKCLKNCKKPDGGFDMNCVLRCPVTRQYKILAN